MKKLSLYEFFGLENFTNDSKKIKQAYRSRCLEWHPDRRAGDRIEAQEMMKTINGVYEVLGTPEKKKEYDRKLKIALGLTPAPQSVEIRIYWGADGTSTTSGSWSNVWPNA